MNRWLQSFNLLGVLALAILCGFQWQRNRVVNLEVHTLERTRQDQAAKLKEHDQTIKGYAADLDGFRQQVSSAKAALQKTEERSTATASANIQMTRERDQLKTSVAEWAKALAEREEQLQTLGAQLRDVATQRNEVVAKFNDLGEKHNKVVQALNERTRRFNELAERYEKARESGRMP